ncbi:MAG: hypothetical protein ACOCQF_02685 [Halanaerobiaceae bacterium]
MAVIRYITVNLRNIFRGWSIIYSLIFIGLLFSLAGLLLYKNEIKIYKTNDKLVKNKIYTFQIQLGLLTLAFGIATFFLPLFYSFFGAMALSVYFFVVSIGIVRLLLKNRNLLVSLINRGISSWN